MYKCIAFDVDGTMINTEYSVLNTLRKVLKEELGKEYTDSELAVSIGMPGEVTLGRFGVRDIDKALGQWYRYLEESRPNNCFFDGVEKTLEVLSCAGYRLAVVTSRKRFELTDDPLFDKIAHYFEEIIAAEDTCNNKPHPDPLLELAKRMDLEGRDILYVGDTAHDMKCAESAEVDFVLAGWGVWDRQTVAANVSLDHPYEIVERVYLHGVPSKVS